MYNVKENKCGQQRDCNTSSSLRLFSVTINLHYFFMRCPLGVSVKWLEIHSEIARQGVMDGDCKMAEYKRS